MNITNSNISGSTITTSTITGTDISDARGPLHLQKTPLARAVQVAITAATSASNGIQQLTNTQNNFGTGNFALQWRGSVPDWTPAANVILLNKHDGTNGYILTLLTTGFLRLTINATNFDSTVVTGMTDNYVAMIDVDITAATTTAAGSVVFTLNGVQLGTTLVISARVEEIVNGTFDTDITGWTLGVGSNGSISWVSGKMRVERSGGGIVSAYQAVSLAAGETFHVRASAVYATGSTSADTKISIRDSANISTSSLLGTSSDIVNGSPTTTYASYYSSTAQTVYVHCSVNGADGGYDYDNITSIDSATVDNTSSLYVCGTSAVRSASQWFSHRLFNRAKTVAENLGMFVNGMAAADVGASQTAVYTSDFSAGADSWTGTSLTVAGNVDGIGGRDNVLSITCTSTGASETPRATRTIFPAEDINKPGEIKIALYRPSSNTTITGLRLNNSSGTGVFTGTSTVNTFNTAAADTWEVFTVSGTMLGLTTSLRFSPVNSAGVRTQVTGEVIYVVDVTGKRLGITSELLAQNAQTDNGQVLDSSGNKQHAKLAEAGMSTQGAISARRREVRWTNTWAGTLELQYIGGINQAILPANAYIESIVGTVSGATPHDITVGDGSDADRYVTITTGLATGTNTFTVAARTTDATNLKLTVTPDTAATMSIAWVITYYRLEG
jgi:hypothetical protein